MNLIIQITITVSGLLALFLTTRESTRYKFNGALVGLIGQPFWLYTAAQNQQWGVFIMAACFTAVYIDIAIRQLRARARQAKHIAWSKG